MFLPQRHGDKGGPYTIIAALKRVKNSKYTWRDEKTRNHKQRLILWRIPIWLNLEWKSRPVYTVAPKNRDFDRILKFRELLYPPLLRSGQNFAYYSNPMLYAFMSNFTRIGTSFLSLLGAKTPNFQGIFNCNILRWRAIERVNEKLERAAQLQTSPCLMVWKPFPYSNAEMAILRSQTLPIKKMEQIKKTKNIDVFAPAAWW